MPEKTAQLLQLLADPAGWATVVHLSRSDALPHDIAATTHHSIDTIMSHLTTLRELGLVTTRQSDVHPSDTFYRLELTAMRQAYVALGMAIHPVVGGGDELSIETPPERRVRVLFLCTGNSARSQMAEGFMRHFSKGTVDVYSAGSKPSQIHPLAIATMDRAGIDIRTQRSKHMDEFIDQHFDYVITVCDQQYEACPVFPGTPQRLHWSFTDPAAQPEDVRERVFILIAHQLRTLIRHFLILLERKDTS